MAEGAVAAPIVFQCGACNRVVSDSNQLLAAVAEHGVLVLDAVVGVRIGEADPADKYAAFLPLHCSACNHVLGRVYQQPPDPSSAFLVHSNATPRYSLLQSALGSYVLGSAAAHSVALDPDEEPAPPDSLPPTANGGDHALQPGVAGRIDALESSEASAQQQLTQLMRVVLALDQRLRSLEEAKPATGEEASGSKRPR